MTDTAQGPPHNDDVDLELIRAVLDQVPLNILWKNRDGKLAGCNRTMADTFGLVDPTEYRGKAIADVIEGGEAFDELHESIMASGEPVIAADFSGDFLDVGRKVLRRSMLPLADADGACIGMVSVIEDRTEVAALENKLVQAQKLEAVGQLAAGIAHEINTPMQYIGDNTHFLKATVARLLAVAEAAQAAVADGASDEDRAALVNVLEKSKLSLLAQRAPKAADDALSGVENVSRIVTAMKRFSHPGSDGMEPVDINGAITTTMTVCRNEWKYSAEIETDLAEDLPVVQGRLGPLNQVWLNMIVNATHAIADAHGDDKGLITITTAVVDDGESVRVSIGDNGAGIEPEILAKVFDPFFTTKEVGKGTGQGLAIAHQVIVGDHRGSLDVDSTIGQGTTFTMTLPTTQPTTDHETSS